MLQKKIFFFGAFLNFIVSATIFSECPFLQAFANSDKYKLVVILIARPDQIESLNQNELNEGDDQESVIDNFFEPDYLHLPHKSYSIENRLYSALCEFTECLAELETKNGAVSAFADALATRFVRPEVNDLIRAYPDTALFEYWLISTAFHVSHYAHDEVWRQHMSNALTALYRPEMDSIEKRVDAYTALLAQNRVNSDGASQEKHIATFFKQEMNLILDVLYDRLDKFAHSANPRMIMRYFLPGIIAAHETGMLKKLVSTDLEYGIFSKY